jgi:hypothetical protein
VCSHFNLVVESFAVVAFVAFVTAVTVVTVVFSLSEKKY